LRELGFDWEYFTGLLSPAITPNVTINFIGARLAATLGNIAGV
jgi:hypothetical protein